MRIVSPFHDYYDCVQEQGQDLSLLYLRQPKEVVLKGQETPFTFTTTLRHRGRDIIEGCNVIGFCGRVMPVLSIYDPTHWTASSVFCYSLAEVDAFVEARFKGSVVEHYYAAKRRSYWSERWRYTSHKTLETFFKECEAQQNQYEHLFRENCCPIFVYRECRAGHIITYNGCLKDMQFYRVIDPYTAFQEIQMYLGSMASPEKPIPKIDDKTLVAAKGFNKWSFRKEPTK